MHYSLCTCNLILGLASHKQLEVALSSESAMASRQPIHIWQHLIGCDSKMTTAGEILLLIVETHRFCFRSL